MKKFYMACYFFLFLVTPSTFAQKSCQVDTEVCLCKPGVESFSTNNFFMSCDNSSHPATRFPSLSNLTYWTKLPYQLVFKNRPYQALPDGAFKDLKVINLQIKGTSVQYIRESVFNQIVNISVLEIMDNLMLKELSLNSTSLSSLGQITLSGNYLEVISDYMFSGLKKVTILDLSNNDINRIEPLAFVDLAQLTQLFLSQNSIKIIPRKLFANQRLLITLSLDSNLIEIIENETFTGLIALTAIKLDQNRIKTIESYAFKPMARFKGNLLLSKQKILNLNPFSFNGINTAKQINLNSNFLTRIVNDTFNGLDALEVLYLQNNSISLFDPSAFKGLIYIRKLLLDNNRIKQFPVGLLKELTYLEELYLNQNELTSVDKNWLIGVEAKLKILNLAANKISSVKNYLFANLVKLTDLNLGQNQISVIESNSFKSLTSLLRLDLSENCIFQLSSNLFGTLKTLDTLLINSNVVKILNRGIFSPLAKLTKLYLTNNQITNVDSGLFSNLTSLKELHMSNNFVKRLDSKAFMGLESKLELLDLSANPLESTDEWIDVLKGLKRLRVNITKLRCLSFKNNTRLFAIDLSHTPTINCFNGLASLTELIVRNTSTRLLRNITFDTYPLIRYLDLSYNTLDSAILDRIPFNTYTSQMTTQFKLILKSTGYNYSDILFSNMPNIFTLDLSENTLHFETCQFFLQGTYFLSELILSNMNLTNYHLDNHINISTFYVQTSENRLYHMNLSFNKIQKIKTWYFKSCADFKKLDLSHNMIDQIESKSFETLVGLTYLDLSFNRIQYLSRDLFGSSRYLLLQTVLLNNNQLKEFILYDIFSGIVYLNLSQNQVASVQNLLANSSDAVDKIQLADFSYNMVTTISEDLFAYSYSIKYLSFGSNQVGFIHEESFRYLDSLQELDLSQNLLSNLTINLFQGLINLQSLNLSHNMIECIQLEHFQTTYNLKSLDISFNPIKFIQDMAVSNLNLLKFFNINFNLDVFRINNTNTLNGLNSIKTLTIFRSLIMDEESVSNMQTSLVPKMSRVLSFNSYSMVFYESISISYHTVDKYSERECGLIVQFIKSNLQLNSYSEDMIDKILNECLMGRSQMTAK